MSAITKEFFNRVHMLDNKQDEQKTFGLSTSDPAGETSATDKCLHRTRP